MKIHHGAACTESSDGEATAAVIREEAPNGRKNGEQPLREAMDWLRDELAPIYEEQMKQFVSDPWQTRNDYIDVILNRTPAECGKVLVRKSRHGQLSDDEQTKMLKLLEMQRHAMLMFTSCGWFFDDISGIEGIQVMKYAARAMQLARETSGAELESRYKEILENAPSNKPHIKNGAVLTKGMCSLRRSICTAWALTMPYRRFLPNIRPAARYTVIRR